MRSPLILKEWPVYLSSRGAAISVCVPAVSRVTDTLTWTILRKNLKSRVCVCTSTGPDYKKLGRVLFSDTCRTLADSFRLCLFSPAAFTTLPGGKRSGCSPWFECTRGRLLQTEQATLGLLNRWQSSPGCQTQWVKCFLALLNFGGLEVVSMTA